MKTVLISKDQAGEFFRNEVLFKDSRIDGYSMDDMVRILTDDKFQFISSQINGFIIAVTAFEIDSLGGGADVHTFVLPEHRKYATRALRNHIEYFKSKDIRVLFTTCSNYNMKVMNFLIKRLGFVIHKVFDITETRDGNPVTLYNLHKVVQ